MRGKRKNKYNKIIIMTLVAMLLIGAYKTFSSYLPFISDKPSGDVTNPLSTPGSKADFQPETQALISASPSDAKLYSPHAILVRLQDQKSVLEIKSGERIYPASLTKIMTAIVAIENISDLKVPIILPEKLFKELYAANASMAGFLPGEEVTAIDLLYGLLLPSGADASMGLAIAVSQSESEFVKLMNKKGRQLGMKDTHFANASGLHDGKHYSTVKDIALLLQYALKNETFRKIFTSERYSTAGTNLHPDGITFYSTLFQKIDSCEFKDGRILGGKTGYTAESGLCLASLAEKNGTEFILVTAGASGNHSTEQYHVIDALTVYGRYLKK